MDLPDITTYLNKFRIFHDKTLFKMTAEEFVKWVSQNKCPIDQHKLYVSRDKKIARCKSKKCGKPKFFIRGQELLRLGGSLK